MRGGVGWSFDEKLIGLLSPIYLFNTDFIYLIAIIASVIVILLFANGDREFLSWLLLLTLFMNGLAEI